MTTEQGRLAALRLSGFQCRLCDYHLPGARCECLLPCPAAGCALGRADTAVTAEPGGLILPDIQTAVTAEEARALADLARGKVVIELGAWHGFSTVVLASVADYVISIDWHMGDDHAGNQYTWEIFQGNMARYGVADRVLVIRERFESALPRLAAEAETPFADGCFIDGRHDEESVTRDTMLVLPLIKPGGFVSWHDYGRSEATGNPGFAVTEVADRYGVAGVAGHLAWWFKPLSLK